MRRLALLTVLLLPSLASGFNIKGTHVLAGLDLGVTLDGDSDAGGLFGFEVSMVEMASSGSWAGFFVCPAWDTTADRGRLTVGPELGWGPVGIDLGLSVDSEGAIGGRLRGILTIAVAGAYVGSTIGADTHAEAGVLLKFPLEL